MGIYNRDYMKEDGPSSGRIWGGGSPNWPPVCKWLIITNAIVFLLQIMVPDSAIQRVLELDSKKVFMGQIWRFFTYAFCHDPKGLFHILFNMLFLWWFGKTLEQMYGSREFLLIYLIGALCAGLAFIGLNLVTHDLASVIGASGSVMAITMLYAAHFPRQKLYIWFVIPIEIRWIVLAYVLFDLFPVIGALTGSGKRDGIAHSAHLGGLAFGFLYWKYGWNLSRYWVAVSNKLNRTPRSKQKPSQGSRRSGRKIIPMPGSSSTSTVTGNSSSDFDKEVDRILQKIVDHGNSSLTEKERSVLLKASERIRKRDE